VSVLTLALLGPTASGKSALAVRLAVHLTAYGRPAEIVNADSMLVYRGMDIGTAKPTREERGGIAHHLIDILDIDETATVADFQRLAREAITSCHDRGVVPIVVGGSALYLRAILDEFAFPGTDPAVRAELEAELSERGSLAMYERLALLAPEAAAEMQPMNGRRIVRALEVIALTGSYRATLPEHRYALPGVVQVGLAIDRATMDARIDARVDEMWARGLVPEVTALASAGCARDVQPRGRWATSRCWRTSTAAVPRCRPVWTRQQARDGSPASSSDGGDATRASSGSTRSTCRHRST